MVIFKLGEKTDILAIKYFGVIYQVIEPETEKCSKNE